MEKVRFHLQYRACWNILGACLRVSLLLLHLRLGYAQLDKGILGLTVLHLRRAGRHADALEVYRQLRNETNACVSMGRCVWSVCVLLALPVPVLVPGTVAVPATVLVLVSPEHRRRLHRSVYYAALCSARLLRSPQQVLEIVNDMAQHRVRPDAADLVIIFRALGLETTDLPRIILCNFCVHSLTLSLLRR